MLRASAHTLTKHPHDTWSRTLARNADATCRHPQDHKWLLPDPPLSVAHGTSLAPCGEKESEAHAAAAASARRVSTSSQAEPAVAAAALSAPLRGSGTAAAAAAASTATPRAGFAPGSRPGSWKLYDEKYILSGKELFDNKQPQLWLQSLRDYLAGRSAEMDSALDWVEAQKDEVDHNASRASPCWTALG